MRPAMITGAVSTALLAPSSQWTGSAGSGYGTANPAAPTNPTRTTAMPWIVPLFVPGVRLTTNTDIWFEAGAFGGLTKVIVYCEGNSTPIYFPQICSYKDTNGLSQTLPRAYKITLDIATALTLSTTGCMQIYAQAFANDGTMQSHVIGPFDIFPATAQYDHASFDVGSGQTYSTVQAALNAAQTATSIWPNIILHDTTNYDLSAAVTSTHNCTAPTPGTAGAGGLATVTAANGITATLVASTIDTSIRLKYDGIIYQGSGVQFDLGNFSTITTETTGIGKLWFNGCKVFNSGGMYALIHSKAQPNTYWLNTPSSTKTNNYYATDSTANNIFYGFHYHNLVRNCTLTNVSSDSLDNNRCNYGSLTQTLDPSGYTTGINALTVTYTGVSINPQIEKTGANQVSGNINLYENNSGTPVFTFAYTSVFSGGQTNYTVQDIANAINGHGSGWAASVLDNTRFAAALSNTPLTPSSNITKTTITPITGLTLVTLFDIHSDGCQNFSVTGYNEPGYADSILGNRAFAFNSWYNINNSQCFFGDHSGTGGATSTQWSDCGIHNNVWQSIGTTAELSQIFGNCSHVVFQDNVLDNQTFSLRSDQASPSTYNPDAYCAFTRNAFEILSWGGTPNANLNIQSQYVRTGSLPSGADSNSKSGGGEAASTIYTNPAYPNPNYIPINSSSDLKLANGTWAGRYLYTGAENS